jgi:hypothetical protein
LKIAVNSAIFEEQLKERIEPTTLRSERFRNNLRLQQVFKSSPPMRIGETGKAVEIIQQALMDLGFQMPVSTRKKGKPDGIFASETQTVVQKFQIQYGLLNKYGKPDGIVGRKTLGKLDELFSGTVIPPIIVKPFVCPATFHKATSFDEYVNLVVCAERALPSLTPRAMLSFLRQLYFGNQPWSKTSPGANLWKDVIPCGLSIADPRSRLGTTYGDLQNSQDIRDTDIGHLFAGLEAMLCPTSTITLEISIKKIILPKSITRINMSNEEFATWGGDLGSAVARKVRDEQDKWVFRPWSAYFGGIGTVASDLDMNGNIDSYAVRQGLTKATCSSTRMMAIPGISLPISQILEEYYVGFGTDLSRARANRFECFAQAIGCIIASRKIINRAAIEPLIVERISSFARAYYGYITFKDMVNRGLLFGLSTNIIGLVLSRAILLSARSKEVTKLFLDWLEARL